MFLGRLSRIDADEREESEIERLDRNWNELLQELRVTQTGVQLLTGFLLTLPFQARFADLTHQQRTLYLVVVGLAAAATTFLVMPVMLHRIVFRAGARAPMVALSHLCALLGGALLGLAMVGVTALLFDVVVGSTAGVLAGASSLLGVLVLWLLVPVLTRRYVQREKE